MAPLTPAAAGRGTPRLLAVAALALTLLLGAWSPGAARAATIIEGGPGSSVATGNFNTCAVNPSGVLRCWGYNLVGQNNVPASIGSPKAVSIGFQNMCAVRADDTVGCWGYNTYGQIVVPASLGPVTQLTTGGYHSCAIQPDGTPVCWGYDDYGQIDLPTDLGKVKAISGGQDHTCAIKSDSTVACWGVSRYGQADPPAGLGPVTEISAGEDLSCAVKPDGTAVCWGGQPVDLPITVPTDLGPVHAISAGGNYACAIRPDGTPTCWGGSNRDGELDIPAGIGAVTQIVASIDHVCAVKAADGLPVCWGSDADHMSSIPANFVDPTPATGTPQTIAFAGPAPFTYGDGPTVLQATATSGLIVNFGVESGPCKISGTLLVGTGAGTCVIQANQGGNDTYFVASPVSRSVQVGKATPAIDWVDPDPIVAGTPLTATQLNATGSVQGTLTYSPAAGTVLAAGPNQTLSVTLTPSDATDYESVTRSVQITVTPAPTTPTATTPVPTTPRPTTPVATTPAATTPVATTPRPTTPMATTPVATTPRPTTPPSTTPVPTTPRPTTPVPTTPRPTTPVPTTPVAKTATSITGITVVTLSTFPAKVMITGKLVRSSDGAAIPGKSLTFTAGATPLCTASTASTGVASCQMTLPIAISILLNCGYSVSFAGDTAYAASTGKGSLIQIGLA